MSAALDATARDPSEPNLVQVVPAGFGLLRPFNDAGVLAAADVHTAVRLSTLAGTADEEVALAIALAVRAPRVGHVSVDLAGIRASAVDAEGDIDLDSLPWPEVAEWLDRVRASDLVAVDPPRESTSHPLVLAGRSLYLERYWRDEVTVAAEILARVGPGATWVGPPQEESSVVTPGPGSSGAGAGEAWERTEERLERLFPGPGSADQLRAARLALSSRFSVIAGGPGTGKTTTVARLLACLFEEAEESGRRLPLVGLAAPTGKAAARMEEAVRAEAARMAVSKAIRDRLGEVSGSTLHRLLGTRFDRPGRFRHNRGHRLPHDVVVVDEASMVSLSLMASLAEAVRPDARLVLVGDPEQLVSVEAGAVLADIVGPAGPAGRRVAGETDTAAGEGDGASGEAGASPPVSRAIAVLRQNHRFAGSLAALSEAVRDGDGDRVVEILSAGDPAVSWADVDPAELLPAAGLSRPGASGVLSELKDLTVAWGAGIRDLAQAGDAAGALEALRRHRVLCAHRRGPAGVGAWNRVIEGWIAGAPPAAADGHWYAGRPVLVTVNDYALRLFNGDTGVAVGLPDGGQPDRGQPDGRQPDRGQPAGRLAVAFDEGRDRPARTVSPTRLSAVETVFAMTVHKSQGSEFDRVTLLLPPAGSRLLTRELLYTAVTRARQAVVVVGTEEALHTAVETPIGRASGLGGRLWGTGDQAGRATRDGRRESKRG